MFQNATQFGFSVMFILSLGVVWGVLYQIYVKATLQERQEKAQKRAAKSSPVAPAPPTDSPPTDQP